MRDSNISNKKYKSPEMIKNSNKPSIINFIINSPSKELNISKEEIVTLDVDPSLSTSDLKIPEKKNKLQVNPKIVSIVWSKEGINNLLTKFSKNKKKESEKNTVISNFFNTELGKDDVTSLEEVDNILKNNAKNNNLHKNNAINNEFEYEYDLTKIKPCYFDLRELSHSRNNINISELKRNEHINSIYPSENFKVSSRYFGIECRKLKIDNKEIKKKHLSSLKKNYCTIND